MTKEQISIPSLEAIERKRALEFLSLSPTEKYEALIKLIEIANEVREAGKAIHKPKVNHL